MLLTLLGHHPARRGVHGFRNGMRKEFLKVKSAEKRFKQRVMVQILALMCPKGMKNICVKIFLFYFLKKNKQILFIYLFIYFKILY